MNIQKMMKQAQDMQKKITDVQLKLEASEIDGSAGGGAVTVRLSGKNNLLKVTIDPSLMNPDEKDVLEDLLVAAHADARKKIDDQFNSQMGVLTSGLNLPPGFKLPF
jgi:DNA-binding YbaB/EbfC family protein